jgi:uncharacterized protein (TIGR02217 family)
MTVQVFEEIRFPVDISWGAVGGPQFRTTVTESAGGQEKRNVEWAQDRGKWQVQHGVKNQEQMDKLIEFFRAMRGRATGFRYKDWTDYQLEAEQFGIGDGATTDFQLTKTYTVGSSSYVRNIKKPVQGIQIFLDSVLQVLTTDYTIDLTTGIVSIVVAPLGGGTPALLTSTGEFDVPVRFDADDMNIVEQFEDILSWQLRVVEIRVA